MKKEIFLSSLSIFNMNGNLRETEIQCSTLLTFMISLCFFQFLRIAVSMSAPTMAPVSVTLFGTFEFLKNVIFNVIQPLIVAFILLSILSSKRKFNAMIDGKTSA